MLTMTMCKDISQSFKFMLRGFHGDVMSLKMAALRHNTRDGRLT